MTGLLIKDFKLLKNQGKYFLTVVIIGFAIMFVGDLEYASFATSYLTFILSLFTLSTVSYDEFDNGMSFLMTLPCSRKDYVREKFLFGFLLITVTWTVTAVFSLSYLKFRYPMEDMQAWLSIEIIFLLCAFLFVSVALPLHLKFGPEKGKTVLFCILGGITLLGIIFYKLTGGIELLEETLEKLESLGAAAVLLGMAAVLLLSGICYVCSERILENRQF